MAHEHPRVDTKIVVGVMVPAIVAMVWTFVGCCM